MFESGMVVIIGLEFGGGVRLVSSGILLGSV